jgi:hypothetical protein
MFCPKCGAELQQNAKFCTKCGNKIDNEAATVTQSPPPSQPTTSNETASTATAPAAKPKWKKVVTWIFLFIVGVIALATLTTSGLMDPVEAHLQALRTGDIDSAYQQTSTAFQANTPLPAFRKFVAAYPILNKHSSFSMEKRGFEGNKGEVVGHLLVDGEEYSRIEFLMTKSGDAWKIQGIHIKSVLVAPVSEHLAALRNKDIASAYEYTSDEFRENTSLPAFQTFVSNYPVLTGHTAFNTDLANQQGEKGQITGYLFWNNKKIAWIEFIMTKNGGEWKIYRMQLKKPEQAQN